MDNNDLIKIIARIVHDMEDAFGHNAHIASLGRRNRGLSLGGMQNDVGENSDAMDTFSKLLMVNSVAQTQVNALTHKAPRRGARARAFSP